MNASTNSTIVRTINAILSDIQAHDLHMTDQHLGEYHYALETCKGIVEQAADSMDAYHAIQDLVRDEMNGRYINTFDAVLDWLWSDNSATLFRLWTSITNQIAKLTA
jgi:hypothetical protein